MRIGGSYGYRLIIFSYNMAYGPQFDLGDKEVVDDLVERGMQGRIEQVHSGAPCSTWSAAHFAPGGPPPLRTREHPWGIPGLPVRDRFHVESHSRLLRGSWEVLKGVATGGGSALNEHPSDRGRPPYPSAYNTAMARGVERRCGFVRGLFSQCMIGARSRKDTTMSGNLKGMNRFNEIPRCSHTIHETLIGLDAEGKFKTRQAQAYPPGMCEVMAQLFIEDFAARSCDPAAFMTRDELEALKGGEVNWPECELRTRHRRPGALSRGQLDLGPPLPLDESKRWRWAEEEHNNILEARAGFTALTIQTKNLDHFGKRALCIGDSQVVVGAYSKGRSSRRVLNHLCRKIAAITLGLCRRVAWSRGGTYERTETTPMDLREVTRWASRRRRRPTRASSGTGAACPTSSTSEPEAEAVGALRRHHGLSGRRTDLGECQATEGHPQQGGAGGRCVHHPRGEDRERQQGYHYPEAREARRGRTRGSSRPEARSRSVEEREVRRRG